MSSGAGGGPGPRYVRRIVQAVATGYGLALMQRLLAVVVVAGLLLAGTQPASAAPPGYYPTLRWVPAADANFSAGRSGSAIDTIVIHATLGSYAGAVSWFRDPHARLSAHYVIRAGDGEITQLVAEADTAFHVRGWNRSAIGIEHEFDPDHGVGYTEALYRSSASLVCAITRRYGIPADRAHIRGHNEIPGTDHTDPGSTWDWGRYMALVRQCAAPVSAGAALSAPTGTDASFAPCRTAACVPEPGLGVGATGPAVTLLQTGLASLGRMERATVQAGGGRFGPVTSAAIRSFQQDQGLPVTGFYGPLTATALFRSLATASAAASDAVLAMGDRSAEVTQLQRDLGALGYLAVVTGYYGPVTRDAVRRFQQDRGISATGNYGPLTRAAMAWARR